MKSVLVIDTPKSCSECPLSVKGMRICLPLGEYCHKGEIHPQCPLKQLEDKEYYKDIVDTLNSEQMHCEANELDDLLNTIYGNSK